MRVLIVGGAGYCGGAVVDCLQGTQAEIRVIDNLLYEEIYLKPVWFERLDIRNRPALATHLD